MKMKFKKFCRTLLILLLVLGVLSSSFGVVVAAVTSQDLLTPEEIATPEDKPEETPSQFVSPTDQYGGTRDGKATLSDDVEPVSQEDMEILQKTFTRIDNYSSWSSDYAYYYFSCLPLIDFPGVTLSPDNEYALYDALDALSYEQQDALLQAYDDACALLHDVIYRVGSCDVIYLPADQDSVFLGPRIFSVCDYYASNYSQTAYLVLKEPDFDEAFSAIDICASEALKEENLINASFAPGVSASFGNAEQAAALAASGSAETVQTLSAQSEQAQVVPLANTFYSDDDDLVFSLDYEIKGEKKNGVETAVKLTGSYGIRDLQAHVICQVEDPLDFQELYCGISGQTFTSVELSGSIKGNAEPEATELDLFIASVEGLNEKRFPIAVLQFQGLTPVYITNQVFDAAKDAIFPTYFLILYADWEGEISIELSTSLEYTEHFNNGLRIFEDGELDLGFEEYPYPIGPEDTPEDELSWSTSLTVNAETDLTLLGGSLVFYVAGVNFAEIGIIRFGAEAECNLTVTAGINDELEISGDKDAYAFIRGYLKLIEAKLKLKIEGKLILDKFSEEVEGNFCLVNLTLFSWGKIPDKYKNKTPVSTMERPEEFASVMCLVCDVSGSMGDKIGSGQTKLEAAQEAAVAVTNTAETWDYGVGVVKFNDSASNLVLPHIDYTYIKDCIALMEDGGGTNIYTGIDAGIEQLFSVKAANKVILLMTDGQDSYESATLDSARVAADAGISIYTIGFGSDVNEDLLREVAEIANGEYRYASTDDLLGIVSGFLYSQQSGAGATALVEVEDTVAEGELSKKTNFTVKNKSGDLVVNTVWPGSFLDTILTDPTGREVDETYPGATIDESQIPSTIVIKNPIPGKWSVRVLGVETSYDQEPFYTLVSFRSTDATPINQRMTTMQQIAAWCLPLGLAITLGSALMLIGLGKTKKEEDASM